MTRNRGRQVGVNEIISKLREGDLRTIGKVPEVVALVFRRPELFPGVLEALQHPDPGVRMRAADALEKITRQQPEFLQPHKEFILEQARSQPQQEVRWHLAQIIPRLRLSALEIAQVAEVLFRYLDDPSKIVQANSLEALVELARAEDRLWKKVTGTLENLAETGSPAVRSRARKLLGKLVRKAG